MGRAQLGEPSDHRARGSRVIERRVGALDVGGQEQVGALEHRGDHHLRET